MEERRPHGCLRHVVYLLWRLSMPIWHRDFNLFVLLERSEELEGVWMAHIPDISTVMQGATASQAVLAAAEAATCLVLHDLKEGREPLYLGQGDQCDEHKRIADIMSRSFPEFISMETLDLKSADGRAMVLQLPTLRAKLVAQDESPEDINVAAWSSKRSDGAHAGG